MGNNIGGGRKKAKVMKIDGQTFKLKTPVRAWDVVKDYPGHVLLESSAVKQFGIRAKPLEPQEELKPKKIYFLVELPKLPKPNDQKAPRRARSAVHMSAKDRLECLMLSRRSISDLSIVKPSISLATDGPGPSNGPIRVKMRLPRAQVAKLVGESKDGVEIAEKIIDLYVENSGVASEIVPVVPEDNEGTSIDEQEGQWKPNLISIRESVKRH